MRSTLPLLLLLLPAVALAQESSDDVQLSTSFTTIVTIDGDRNVFTTTQSQVVTITGQQAEPSGSASGSGSGNSTASASGNSTITGSASRNATSSTSTTPTTLPTADPSVNGGGGANGAPLPGATSNGQVYGPDDDYINSASTLTYGALALIPIGMLFAVL